MLVVVCGLHVFGVGCCLTLMCVWCVVWHLVVVVVLVVCCWLFVALSFAVVVCCCRLKCSFVAMCLLLWLVC